MLGLEWHPAESFSLFYRYQQGYRAGGLAITLAQPTAQSDLQVRRFEPDDLYMHELGVRLGDKTRDRLSFQATIFLADWRNIQADLVGDLGLPTTTNIGSGIIHGLDGEIFGRPGPSFALSASAFLNDSKLADPVNGLSFEEAQGTGNIARTLPNIARGGSRIAAAWSRQVAAGAILSSEISLRYVGLSHLGFGTVLDVPQGNYAVADIGGRLDFGGIALTLNIDNIGDRGANTFAYGNPFGLTQQQQQITPLRPRTIRLGVSARF